MAMLKIAIEENAELQKLIKPIVLAVRSELEMRIDTDLYSEVLEAAATRGQARMEKFMDGLGKLLLKSQSKLPTGQTAATN